MVLVSCAGEGRSTSIPAGNPLPDLETSSGSTDKAPDHEPPQGNLLQADDSVSVPDAVASPTPAPPIVSTTTTSLPTVILGGFSYTCEEASAGKWDCRNGVNTAYCSGYGTPQDCSELWYPDALASARLVEFRNSTYVCETYGNGCVRYVGGPPPSSFYSPDIWCDGVYCYEYDPDEWFEVTFASGGFICQESFFDWQQYDCQRYFGGRAPSSVVFAELYCSGSKSFPECSEHWYPDELDDYELISMGGFGYLCDGMWTVGWDDYDCGSYSGGDPSLVLATLKCTDRGYTFECNRDYYPSEMDGYFLSNIGGTQHVCEDTWQGSECYMYYSGSPSSATMGLPDYYCNSYGECDRYGYP